MKTETTITVRYAETDQMGIVHHSNYAVWFEAGRTDYMKKAGVSNSDVEARGVIFPLYEMRCRFISPARYEDEVKVITCLETISRVRARFTYQVTDARSGRLIATGETSHAWADKTLKPINAQRAVPDIYKVFQGLCEDTSDTQG